LFSDFDRRRPRLSLEIGFAVVTVPETRFGLWEQASA
jgi:hypothetical protein